MTQQDKILHYMKNHRSITPMEAFKELGCTRLAAQVFELKKKGHNIVTHDVHGKNREGEPVRYASYTLENNE